MLPGQLKVKLQYLLPKHLLSRLVGKLAAAQAGKLTTRLITLFIKHYQVNMAEAELSSASDYASFNEFFTRPLKPGLRPVCRDEHALVHPVDGAISQYGQIRERQILQAKGHDYSTTAILGGDQALAEQFDGGEFMTIYLAPKDYHRIHMPVTGTLTDMIFVPGELFSVNPLTAENIPGLFARNERVVALFDTEYGKMAMILVGATIVASIETVWAGTVAPNIKKRVMRKQYQDLAEPITLEKGEEMGRFKLGSTVVMLFESEMVSFTPTVTGETTRMGVKSGTLTAQRK